jgi:CRP-like cAMP-binding protein
MAIQLSELQTISALRHLSEASLCVLAAVMTRQTFAPGELIFIEGEQALGIWFVLSGQVRILKYSASGRTQALCIAHRGKCFGTCPLFTREDNPASAQALDEVTLLILPDAEAGDLMQREPTIARTLLQLYSERLSQLARLSERLGTWTVAHRLNDCLLDYAIPSSSDAVYSVVALTHEKLAELAGTVREVASRHLEQLEASGIVRLHSGAIHLIHPEKLQLPCQLDEVLNANAR